MLLKRGTINDFSIHKKHSKKDSRKLYDKELKEVALHLFLHSNTQLYMHLSLVIVLLGFLEEEKSFIVPRFNSIILIVPINLE